MASMAEHKYSDKYTEIDALRWPSRRSDRRLKGALYFWTTVPETDDFEIVRLMTDEEKYADKSLIKKHDDPFVEANEKLWKASIRADMFREHVSDVYGMATQDVVPISFNDELGNTYYVALNEDTTDADTLLKRIQRFNELTREVGLSQEAALRAVCSTEIFTFLINQVWEAVDLKNKQYLIKMVEVIGMCMSFVEMSGLLFDRVFMTMSGHLDTLEQDLFEKLDDESQTYSYSNQFLRYDTCFNVDYVRENWPKSETDQLNPMTLALYFNDSCVYSPENPDGAWRQAIPYLAFHLVDCEKHSIVRNRLLLDAFTLFTLKVCEREMFDHSVVPNELGNVYVIFDGITPAHRTSYILSTAAWMAVESRKLPGLRSLTRLTSAVMDFKVPGYFRDIIPALHAVIPVHRVASPANTPGPVQTEQEKPVVDNDNNQNDNRLPEDEDELVIFIGEMEMPNRQQTV